MEKERAKKQIAKRYRALGTVIDLAVYGSTDENLLDGAFHLIQHYEYLLTVNRPLSELMTVNLAAGKSAVQVSDAVYQLTKQAVEQSQKHFGFNAAIGPLVKLWHIGFKDAKLPTAAEIEEKLALVSPDKIELSDADFSIFLPKAGMELDLGAIAKGYIADRVRDYFAAYGVSSAIINLGGNLVLMGSAPHHDDQNWRIGIRDPFGASDEAVVQLLTRHCSVVTSGIAERHFEINGRSYHHIFDSKTGYPFETDLVSVTVITDKSVDAEIETTRLFFAQEIPADYAHSAIFIYQDKSVKLVNIEADQLRIINHDFYIK
ncbi:FAD:protein FMN transferase [Lactococcus sp.]|uniref:FAD:protein FMN transferase n=1 Tax=Lactococcus sp. TaxID=44273 RepID=UPI0035B4C2E4